MAETAPGISEILRHFSWDVPWIGLLCGAGAMYLLAMRRDSRKQRAGHHPKWRAAAFISGLVVIALVVLSPLEHYGNQLLWVNFTGFLLLTMMAAPLLLAGAPLTLAFRVSGRRRQRQLVRLYRSRPVTLVTFPPMTWLTFAVVTYCWQFTGLADDAARDVFVRDLQQATLLLVALLFWQPAVAADPLRWRLPYPLRALYVFVEMTHKGLFGGMFLSMNHPMHDHFAANVPPWGPSPMTDQRMAILILWIGGNLIFLAVLVGLVAGWVQYEKRNAARTDRRLEQAREAARRRRLAIDQVFDKPI